MNFIVRLSTFFDSQYHAPEAIPALPLVIGIALLLMTSGDLTGVPEGALADKRISSEHKESKINACLCVVVLGVTIVTSIGLALYLSITGLGAGLSFVGELILMGKYFVLVLVEIVFAVLAVAGLVKGAIKLS